MTKRSGTIYKFDRILFSPGMKFRDPIRNMEHVRRGTPKMAATKARYLILYRDHLGYFMPIMALMEKFTNPILKTK